MSSPFELHYRGVAAIRMDRVGNLRLYRERRWGWLPLRQDVFHPANSWVRVMFSANERVARVELPPPEVPPPHPYRLPSTF